MGQHHIFDIDIATIYGLNEAILMQNIYFWIDKNKSNNKHLYRDRYWTYNSIEAFGKLFPYMGKKQISNAIKRLVDTDILLKDTFSSSQYNRTNWYSFTDLGMLIIKHDTETINSLLQNKLSDCVKTQVIDTDCLGERGNALCQKGKTITDVNITDVNTDIKETILLKAEEPNGCQSDKSDNLTDLFSVDNVISNEVLIPPVKSVKEINYNGKSKRKEIGWSKKLEDCDQEAPSVIIANYFNSVRGILSPIKLLTESRSGEINKFIDTFGFEVYKEGIRKFCMQGWVQTGKYLLSLEKSIFDINKMTDAIELDEDGIKLSADAMDFETQFDSIMGDTYSKTEQRTSALIIYRKLSEEQRELAKKQINCVFNKLPNTPKIDEYLKRELYTMTVPELKMGGKRNTNPDTY